jgi:A/G-specific adenine glycosylase
MLQQTQVATVLPYYAQFLRSCPTIRDLAATDEQQILRLWQGLGYYSRARNLLKAARFVVEKHEGEIPTTVAELLELPGVGRYTAGAIASIAHGTRAPILDGNVIRVLCRLDAIRSDPREKATNALLWARAAEIVPHDRPGDFNSAMMELGATVCTPRNPQCLICPVAKHCSARELGIQEQIPPVKKAKQIPHATRVVYCLFRDRAGKREYAFEQRPATGRWAGMWQFVTRNTRDETIDAACATETIGSVDHALTHRRYTFEIQHGSAGRTRPVDATWHALDSSEKIPLPRPHVKIREMLRAL